MKKYILRLVAIGFISIPLIIIGFVIWFWNYPGHVVNIAKGFLPEEIKSNLTFESIQGNPLAGYTIKGLSFEKPSFHVSAKLILFKLSWLDLLGREVYFKELEIEEPHAHLKNLQGSSGPSHMDKTEEPKWFLTITRGSITRGKFTIQEKGALKKIEQIDMKFTYQNNRLDLAPSHASIQSTTFTAKGHIQHNPLQGDISLKSDGVINGRYEVKGSSHGWTLAAQGNKESPQGLLEFDLNAKGRGFDPQIMVATARLDLDFRNPFVQSSATLNVQTIGKWPHMTIDLGGHLMDARISSDTFPSIQFSLKGSQESLKLWAKVQHETSYSEWETKSPFAILLRPPSYEITNLNLTDGAAHFSLNAGLRKKSWDTFNAKIDGLELRKLKELGLIRFPAKGQAKATLRLQGKIRQPDGSVDISIKQLALKDEPIGDIFLAATMSNSRLDINKLDVNTPHGNVRIQASLPAQEKIHSHMNFDTHIKANDFDFAGLLKSFFDIEIWNGRLNADLGLARQKNQLTTSGTLELTADQFRPIYQGPELTQLHILLEGEGSQLVIKKGKARSQKVGRVELSGNLEREKPDMKLVSQNLFFKWPLGIQGTLDTDMALTGTWANPQLEGLILIRQADYNPSKRKKQKKTPTKSPPSSLLINLDVQFDRNVWFKQKQTAIEWKGKLTIKKDPFEEPRVYGKIETLRGEYVAYGRVFKIEEGSINFAGYVPINPFLSLKAVYIDKVSKIRVYLVVTGSLKNPKLTLTSEPPLDEADIVSVLTTGKPLYELGEDGKGVNSTQVAQNIVAGYLSEEIRQELQNFVALDIFRVNMADNETADVVVGKNIAQDLFVSYGQTLGPSGEQRINAEYELSRHWSLEGHTTSLGRYVIDLLFRFGFK